MTLPLAMILAGALLIYAGVTNRSIPALLRGDATRTGPLKGSLVPQTGDFGPGQGAFGGGDFNG